MNGKIDLVLFNAKIYTGENPNSIVEALAVSNGKITAVGSNTSILSLDGARSAGQVLDLKGATVVAGLNDTHIHFLWWALGLQQLKLAGVGSLAGTLAMVAEKANTLKPGTWIKGQGWDKNLWGTEFPDRHMLDAVSPQNPVALHSKDAHLLWVNSKALEIAGITRDTLAVEGGEITVDSNGEPTGILKETATRLVFDAMPEPSTEEATAAVLAAQTEAHKLGLTGIQTIENYQIYKLYKALHAQGKLALRTAVLLDDRPIPELTALGLKQGSGDEMLWLGQLKFFMDGALGSQTAAMFEPYLNSPDNRNDNYGLLRVNPEEFEQEAKEAVLAGFGLAVHAIGDRAAALALDVIEKLPRTDATLKLRHRMEHLQILRPQDLPRVARNNIVASVQPLHATSDRDIADYYWGEERASRSYAYRTLQESGAVLAFGSDAPVEEPDPRRGIYAAVTRKREGEDRPAWYPGECLPVFDAVRGYNQGATYTTGDDHRRGKIVPGMAADFTIFGEDIFTIPEKDIPTTPIVATIVDGKIVYQNN